MSDPPTEELATEKISIRCSPSLKAAIKSAARRDGRKPSQWIVHTLETILKDRGMLVQSATSSPEKITHIPPPSDDVADEKRA